MYIAFHGFGQTKFPYGGLVFMLEPIFTNSQLLEKQRLIQKWSKFT